MICRMTPARCCSILFACFSASLIFFRSAALSTAATLHHCFQRVRRASASASAPHWRFGERLGTGTEFLRRVGLLRHCRSLFLLLPLLPDRRPLFGLSDHLWIVVQQRRILVNCIVDIQVVHDLRLNTDEAAHKLEDPLNPTSL